jgi:hypothetical protein
MLQLSGWSRARRVVVLRRRVRGSVVAEIKADATQGQQTLLFADPMDDVKLWEYTVLVTNTDHTLEAIGQLYRDRADCENGFDELKNPWVGAATPTTIWNAATSPHGRWP